MSALLYSSIIATHRQCALEFYAAIQDLLTSQQRDRAMEVLETSDKVFATFYLTGFAGGASEMVKAALYHPEILMVAEEKIQQLNDVDGIRKDEAERWNKYLKKIADRKAK